jgi:hypothetical protein
MFPCLPTRGNIVAETKFASREAKMFPTNFRNIWCFPMFLINVPYRLPTLGNMAKHWQETMFPQQCFLVCFGRNCRVRVVFATKWKDEEKSRQVQQCRRDRLDRVLSRRHLRPTKNVPWRLFFNGNRKTTAISARRTKSITTARKSMLKWVKLQSLSAKCCKMRKI